MIIITGAAGFIGSNLLSRLNAERFRDIILVDDFSNDRKRKNTEKKVFSGQVDRRDFFHWLPQNHKFVQFIFHIGARTDTTELDKNIFDELNVEYSKNIWNACVEYGLPLVYASSAATYGKGDKGYSDDHRVIKKLKPLNPYGESKNEFDKWALIQKKKPYFWAGLKLFNVYGPNEYHKDRMASVVFHAFHQVRNTGKIKLFRSHRPDYKDGEQKRDFIYVKDVVNVMCFFMQNRKNSGIYNVGTGKARTFLDLADNLFKSMKIPKNIEFIDTPEDIRETYQYFTEAPVEKLRSIGYATPFSTLENGVSDYIEKYLVKGQYA